eukprot:jgi/Hompol1/2923/HPOL_006233-RA
MLGFLKRKEPKAAPVAPSMAAAATQEQPPRRLGTLGILGSKGSKVLALLDQATGESQMHIDWPLVEQANETAKAAGMAGPGYIVDTLLQCLAKGPAANTIDPSNATRLTVQQHHSLSLLFYYLRNGNDAVLKRLYSWQSLSRLLSIWSSQAFSLENRAMLSAIVDIMPDAPPGCEIHWMQFKSDAQAAGLTGVYEADLIIFELPGESIHLPALMQSLATSNGHMYTIPPSDQPALMDFTEYTDTVNNHANMLLEAVNFADPKEPVTTNEVIQEFRTHCIDYRRRTNDYLRSGALSEKIRRDLTKAFEAYDQLLDSQLVEQAVKLNLEEIGNLAVDAELLTANAASRPENAGASSSKVHDLLA